MNIQNAFNILGIANGQVTQEDIIQAYRKACMKYHPDRNPAGLEMMKLINAAREALKDFTSGESVAGEGKDYGEAINAALNAVVNLGLNIEICGAWVWLTGDTKPHKEVLKAAGFLWAPKKLAWYFRPEEHKRRKNFGGLALSLDEIRAKYGSDRFRKKEEETQRNLPGQFKHYILKPV
jgi:curved DNA-binding protein CbpA